MHVLGISISKDVLLDIAKESGIDATPTPAANVIKIDFMNFDTFQFFAALRGLKAEISNETGRLLVSR